MFFKSLYEDAVGVAVRGISATAAEGTEGAADGERTGRRVVSNGGMLGNVFASCGGKPAKFGAIPGLADIAGREKEPGENDIGGRFKVEGKPGGRPAPAGVNSVCNACLGRFAKAMFGSGGIDIPGIAKLCRLDGIVTPTFVSATGDWFVAFMLRD